MGTFFWYQNLRFFAFSGDHRPLHVHVEYDGAEAKIQVEGGVMLVYNHGFSDRTMGQILEIVKKLQKRIIAEWEAQIETK